MTSRVTRLAVSAAMATVAMLPHSTTSSSEPVIDRSPSTAELIRARRTTRPPPALDGRFEHIGVLGDSLYFDHSATETGPPNATIPTIRSLLRRELRDPDLRVENLSRPGLAVAFLGTTGALGFITMAEWIAKLLEESEQLPDLMVIPVPSTDLNANQDTPVSELAPAIIDSLQHIVDDLGQRGVPAVVVPSFGINDPLFDAAKSVFVGVVECNANSRGAALNAALSASQLPMLFSGFRGLDRDQDSEVDAHWFVGYDPVGRTPDDGLHPNDSGQRLIGRTIGLALANVIAESRAA